MGIAEFNRAEIMSFYGHKQCNARAFSPSLPEAAVARFMHNLCLQIKAIIFVLASHILLLLYLNFFNESVASESINAMVFRVSIWSIIALIILNYLKI